MLCVYMYRHFNLLPTPTLSVGVVRMIGSVCLFVCLSVCLSQLNSKTNDPKVLKLGIRNDLGISYKRHGFGVERSKVKVMLSYGCFIPPHDL